MIDLPTFICLMAAVLYLVACGLHLVYRTRRRRDGSRRY